MLNRNAEALFWIGRYIERAENHARLIDVHYHIQQEEDFQAEGHKWSRLIDALGVRNEYLQQFESFGEQDVLSFITLDLGNTNSLFSCVHQARNNLRTLRQHLPSELWDIANSFNLWLGEQSVADIMNSPHQFYQQIKERAAMFLGAEQSVMLRGNEWHFIESGRFLERAENTTRILQAVTVSCKSKDINSIYTQLQAVLKSVSGYQAFRRYYADDMSPECILEFLIVNPHFPRSIRFSFHKLEEHLAKLELDSSEKGSGHEKVIRQAGKIKAELDYMEKEEMSGDLVEDVLQALMLSCQKLGKTMEGAFFRREGVSV
ncbi:alpha-E domain-containing protein [Paenibacillus sp. LMG 31459]|uniref:Alpha-E domain-containing protein n=1 Tax=Paenibacillus phytohabitans TaxID=2654978 RepID=A0ABX1YPB9_9BACL|nr:alpha-E domain-containing protein [Paenibacillus phytohabitans]NOU81936.1 alpha-E domain-containing protein [Paenibacillus phytohabitans]